MDYLYGIILAVALGLLTNIITIWIAPDKAPNKPALKVAAIGVIIFCAVLAWYKHSDPPYEIQKYDEKLLAQKISNAKFRVWATGTSLSALTPAGLNDLTGKIKKNGLSTVKLIMLKPSSDAAKARVVDENNPAIPSEIAKKLVFLRDLIEKHVTKNDKDEDKMSVKCSNVYPTIAVYIIDYDLYTYSYRSGDIARDSTLIIFRNFETNQQITDLANFFKSHFDSIEEKANEPEDIDYNDKIVPNIVFVDEHGSAESMVAAVYFNKLASERGLKLQAIARGINSDKEVSPKAAKWLEADDLKALSAARPQKLSEADVAGAIRIVAFNELPEGFNKAARVERWDKIPSVSATYGRPPDAMVERIKRLLDELKPAKQRT